jgi:regulator of RNase E activity RraA
VKRSNQRPTNENRENNEMTHHQEPERETRERDVEPIFNSIREHLFSSVIGDVLDSLGHFHQILPAYLRPMKPEMKLVGRAMPVQLADVFGVQAEPFGKLTLALDQLEHGEVYVATGGVAPCSAWGEILTTTAKARGAVGAVVDSYHRDTPKILELDWPVFSRGPYAQDAAVRSIVEAYRVPVEIGGVLVRPGDLIMGDVDGVVVIPREIEGEVVGAALEKVFAENLVLDAIRGGMSSTNAFDKYGVL